MTHRPNKRNWDREECEKIRYGGGGSRGYMRAEKGKGGSFWCGPSYNDRLSFTALIPVRCSHSVLSSSNVEQGNKCLYQLKEKLDSLSYACFSILVHYCPKKHAKSKKKNERKIICSQFKTMFQIRQRLTDKLFHSYIDASKPTWHGNTNFFNFIRTFFILVWNVFLLWK